MTMALNILIGSYFRHVVEKILEELDQFGLSESGQELNMDMLRKLTYVNAVVKEALRVAPPVGAGFRTALKSFTLNVRSLFFLFVSIFL